MARLLILALLIPLNALAQPLDRRIVVATNVACREEPQAGTRVLAALNLPEMVFPQETRVGGDGETVWLRLRLYTPDVECWVAEALTTPLDRDRPNDLLLLIADRMLASPEGRPLEDFVRVDNLFAPMWSRWTIDFDVESSPLLSLRHLQIVTQGMRSIRRWDQVPDDPLKQAWVFSHGSIIAPTIGGYMVTREAYWDLHDRFSDSPMAEELLWEAARHPARGECEADGDCYLERIRTGLARYWQAYPEGRFIEDALLGGVRAASYLTRCGPRSGAHSTPEGVEAVRQTLAGVAEVRKAELLEVLDEIEERCLVGSP